MINELFVRQVVYPLILQRVNIDTRDYVDSYQLDRVSMYVRARVFARNAHRLLVSHSPYLRLYHFLASRSQIHY